MVADEEFSIAVEQFDVLYDKSHPDFHRKDIKNNAWKAVAEKLGLEDGKFIKKHQFPIDNFKYFSEDFGRLCCIRVSRSNPF